MYKSAHQLKELTEQFIEKGDFGQTPEGLYGPIKYLMDMGGKRLRPLLTLMSYQLFSDRPEDILSQAVSVELFHNFTLMHDDIMDNAPLRRGKTTVHEKWDHNTAILSGDVMFSLSYKFLLEGQQDKAHFLVPLFNECAIGVCEGQQYDMDFENREDVSEEDYLKMVRLKTSVLLGYALELGAVLADQPEQGKALREFGINIGMGFQLKDDLLDLYADKDKFGKQIGGDILSRKKTFLYITALSQAGVKEQKKIKKLYESTNNLDENNLVDEVKTIFDRLYVKEKTEHKINSFFDDAFSVLKKVQAPINRKTVLRDFARSLIERQQ